MDKKTRLSLSTPGSRSTLPRIGKFIYLSAPVLSQNEKLDKRALFQQYSQAMERI